MMQEEIEWFIDNTMSSSIWIPVLRPKSKVDKEDGGTFSSNERLAVGPDGSNIFKYLAICNNENLPKYDISQKYECQR